MLALWLYANQQPTIYLGMSKEAFVGLLEHYDTTVDLPPPQFEAPISDATSILYWKDRSEEWIVPDFSITILAAFEDSRLVHLMAWDWTDYGARSPIHYRRISRIVFDHENTAALLRERND